MALEPSKKTMDELRAELVEASKLEKKLKAELRKIKAENARKQKLYDVQNAQGEK